MAHLIIGWLYVLFAGCGQLFGPCLGIYTARAVKTGTVYSYVIIDNRFVDVGIVYHGIIYINHSGIVLEGITGPSAAYIACTAITIAIVYTAIETNVPAPVTLVKKIHATIVSPIAGGPQEAHAGGSYPNTGYPVIATIVGISPVTGSP